jgi:hypothetical protein
MNEQHYKNQKGIDFLTADVPLNADYFGYIIQVTADDNPKLIHAYKACVKKSLCQSEQAADIPRAIAAVCLNLERISK